MCSDCGEYLWMERVIDSLRGDASCNGCVHFKEKSPNFCNGDCGEARSPLQGRPLGGVERDQWCQFHTPKEVA
jgi:hypothetical protein